MNACALCNVTLLNLNGTQFEWNTLFSLSNHSFTQTHSLPNMVVCIRIENDIFLANSVLFVQFLYLQPRASSVRPQLDGLSFPPRFDLAPENDFFA